MTPSLLSILQTPIHTQPRILFADIADTKIIDAIKTLIDQWYFPIICWKTSELSRYGDIDIEHYIVPEDENNLIFASQKLQSWDVDGVIAGNISSTRGVVRAFLKSVWVAENIHRISTYFLWEHWEGLFLFSDGWLCPDPSAPELAEIIQLCITNAQSYNIPPKISLLSWTMPISKMQQATDIFTTQYPDIDISVNIDFETAYNQETNIYIFPDLNAGNIGYKIAERMWGYEWQSKNTDTDATIEHFQDNTWQQCLFVYPRCIAYPTPQELADLAYETLEILYTYHMPLYIAFLSFSTYGSADHQLVEKTKNTIQIFRNILITDNRSDIWLIEHETQFDAAFIPEIWRKKWLNIDTPATVYVFPDHHSGYLATQIAKHIGWSTMIGPLIQGLKKPGYDLSRWVSRDDIVTTFKLMSLQIDQTK